MIFPCINGDTNTSRLSTSVEPALSLSHCDALAWLILTALQQQWSILLSDILPTIIWVMISKMLFGRSCLNKEIMQPLALQIISTKVLYFGIVMRA